MKIRKYPRIQLLSALLLASGSAFSAITSGQLTVINGLANGINPGATGSSINVQVSDSMGVCSSTRILLFNGSMVIKWDANKAHSINQCNQITSVAVTPLRVLIGTVSTLIYDSTSTTPIPASTATSAINYTAPTSPIANLVLLVTGTGIPASSQTVTANTWGIGAASAPVFNTANGDLVTVGVPGGAGMAGLKAEQAASHYGVSPYSEKR